MQYNLENVELKIHREKETNVQSERKVKRRLSEYVYMK